MIKMEVLSNKKNGGGRNGNNNNNNNNNNDNNNTPHATATAYKLFIKLLDNAKEIGAPNSNVKLVIKLFDTDAVNASVNRLEMLYVNGGVNNLTTSTGTSATILCPISSLTRLATSLT